MQLLFGKFAASCFVLATLFLTVTLAAPSPTIPYGETLWKSGDQVNITWTDSGQPAMSSMSGITIQFMTGPDLNQIPLANIAPKLANTVTSFQWTVPSLAQFGYPPGKLYFLMFSDPASPSLGVSWSTRFTILEGSTPPITYTPGTPWTITKSAAASPTSAAPITTSLVVSTTSTTITPTPVVPTTSIPDPTTSSSDTPSTTPTSQTDDPNSTASSQPVLSGNDKNSATTALSVSFKLLTALTATLSGWFLLG